MQMKVRHVSYVLDFMDKDFDTDSISDALTKEFSGVFESIKNSKSQMWEIQFRATYTNGKMLLISKNKFGNYTSDKIKEITIPIPIPVDETVSWGVKPQQHTLKVDHYDKLLNNFWELDVDYTKFFNRTDYIMDCMRRAINLCFEKSYTVNGVKLNKKE
ncbi:hypothetical protein FKG96_06210 [Olivibacter sp. LS-1]|nr:hypothetical protein FKG96_06210 [Olivibacter sp. LS-1]